MKKHMGFIMVGMLALAALGFTACDWGEEGEYWVTFENYSNQKIQVNCTKGTPSLITLEAPTGTNGFTSEKVLFTTSNIKGNIIPSLVGAGTTDFDALVKTTVNRLTVVFQDND